MTITSGMTYFPNTKHADKEIIRETIVQHLAHNKNIASESALEHDGHVASIEKLDRVCCALPAESVALDGDLNTETLKIDDKGKNDNSGNQVGDVRESVPPKRLFERARLVIPREQEVEERDNRALKLGTTAGVHGGGAEGLPDDRFANVSGNEQGDTRTKAVTLLKKFI